MKNTDLITNQLHRERKSMRIWIMSQILHFNWASYSILNSTTYVPKMTPTLLTQQILDLQIKLVRMSFCLFQRKQLKCNRFYLYGQLRIDSPVWIISYESVWEYLIWKPFLYQALSNQNHSLSICKNQIFIHYVRN